jgi:hypothetical protein
MSNENINNEFRSINRKGTWAASYWPCRTKTAARFIVEPKKLFAWSKLFLRIIELINCLTKSITSAVLGKQADRWSPSEDLGKSSKQANVKSEDPSFLCKDTSSAIPVKMGKINGVSWLENILEKQQTINIYNTNNSKSYKLRKQTVTYLQNVQCLYLQKLSNEELFPCKQNIQIIPTKIIRKHTEYLVS